MKSSKLRKTWMVLRKFGLGYDDFPTMLENVALLLKVSTINIYKKAENPYNRPTAGHSQFSSAIIGTVFGIITTLANAAIHIIYYIMTSIAGSLYFYVYIISMLWMVLFRYGKTEIESSIIVFAISSCNVTCLTKFVFMMIYSKEIKNSVDKFLHCDTLVIPGTRFAKNLKKKLRVVKKRASFIWVFLMSIGVVYLSIPFFIPGRHFTTDIYLLYGLEPMVKSPNYEIAMFIIIVGIGFGVYTMGAVAIYVIVVVGYNEAQLRALSEELRNVWNDSGNFYNHIKHRVKDKIHVVYIKEQIMNEFIRIRLKDIVQFHIANINLLHELDNEFSPTLAIEYSIMTLSVIAGLLAGLKNSYLQLPYTFIQMFMDCLAGQRLIDACDYFMNSVYSCQWENFNTTNQKTVLLMLMMSQKTLMLSAGGVAKLNFNCLMIIFKSTYSTYTTLKSVVKK